MGRSHGRRQHALTKLVEDGQETDAVVQRITADLKKRPEVVSVYATESMETATIIANLTPFRGPGADALRRGAFGRTSNPAGSSYCWDSLERSCRPFGCAYRGLCLRVQ